jgi:hypothetical protein
MCYLVEKYAKDESLYPKDPKKRAMVNQKLYFDATTLYQRFLNYYVSNIKVFSKMHGSRIHIFICLKNITVGNYSSTLMT